MTVWMIARDDGADRGRTQLCFGHIWRESRRLQGCEIYVRCRMRRLPLR